MYIKPQSLLLCVALLGINSAYAQSTLTQGQNHAKPTSVRAAVNFVINISHKLELNVHNQQLAIQGNSGTLMLVDSHGQSRYIPVQNGVTQANTQQTNGVYTIVTP